jgi:phosphatidylserine/phosphatidylglycerophosphate/cardiolipin synthase-like enzyme
MKIYRIALASLFAFSVSYGSGSLAFANTSGHPRKNPPPSSSSEDDSSDSSPIANLDTCFSPAETCDQKLITLIDSTRSTLDIAIYSITHAGITNAILAAKNRGVRVRMVVDRLEARGNSSSVPQLQSGGVNLKIGNFRGIMHDKFSIADGKMLETGSYNYSANATANNAENQLYLTEINVISRYQTNFDQMFADGI